MLENIDKVSDMTEADRRRYIGYVHFMRGYAYYHLLMNYGPLLIVGDEVLGTSESAEYYDRERSTYDESVDYICNEFKLATQGIYGPTEQSISYSDRPTKGAALALIARLRLFQASPLFNGGDAARLCFSNWKRKSDGADYVNQTYDPDRWAVAAAAAKQVINMEYCSQWHRTINTLIRWQIMFLRLLSPMVRVVSTLTILLPICSTVKVLFKPIKSLSGQWHPKM